MMKIIFAIFIFSIALYGGPLSPLKMAEISRQISRVHRLLKGSSPLGLINMVMARRLGISGRQVANISHENFNRSIRQMLEVYPTSTVKSLEVTEIIGNGSLTDMPIGTVEVLMETMEKEMGEQTARGLLEAYIIGRYKTEQVLLWSMEPANRLLTKLREKEGLSLRELSQYLEMTEEELYLIEEGEVIFDAQSAKAIVKALSAHRL